MLHYALTDILNRLGATAQGLGDLLIHPIRALHIGLQQNLSVPHLFTRPCESANHLCQFATLLIRKSHDTFLANPSLFALNEMQKAGSSKSLLVIFQNAVRDKQ